MELIRGACSEIDASYRVTRGGLTRVTRVEKTVWPSYDPVESEESEVAMNSDMSGGGYKRGATPVTE